MNKKGLTGKELFAWIIGIVILIVIIFLIPGQLFAKLSYSILSFGAGLLPEEKTPQISAKPRVTPELDKYFDNLVSKIKNSGSGEICRVEIGFISTSKDLSIGLHQNKVQIEKKDVRGRLTPPEKTETINGFKPCSVKGDKANRFYYCLINGIGCTDAYEEGDVAIDANSNIAPFLFKFDKNHLCVFYLKGFDIEQIRRVYSDCDTPTSPKKQFDECGAINFCYKETGLLNARPDLGCTPGTPTAFFKTKDDCIKGSKCIKGHTDKIKFNDCDDNNKEGDIWVWPKYFLR